MTIGWIDWYSTRRLHREIRPTKAFAPATSHTSKLTDIIELDNTNEPDNTRPRLVVAGREPQ